MLHTLLADVICQAFEKDAGKFKPDVALKVKFKTKIDHDKEEGYRYADLLIWGPMNYVGVFTRTRWNVIALDDLEYNEEDGENYIKAGKDYSEGASSWEKKCYHDSCWRDAVREFLFQNRGSLSTFDSVFDCWYEAVEVPEEIRQMKL